MSVVETPHFDFPFNLSARGADVVEQDTVDDVGNCVVAILNTHITTRDFVPEFGIPDISFRVYPLDADVLLTMIGDQEPRALMTGREQIDRTDNLIDIITIKLHIATQKGA
jgi:hypothetical protein